MNTKYMYRVLGNYTRLIKSLHSMHAPTEVMRTRNLPHQFHFPSPLKTPSTSSNQGRSALQGLHDTKYDGGSIATQNGNLCQKAVPPLA